MKRDLDYCRAILLAMENSEESEFWQPEDLEKQGLDISDDKRFIYHIGLLQNAGFIEAVDVGAADGSSWVPERITWEGHEFLDTVRNQSVWDKSKSQVKEAAGTASLAVISGVATNIVKGMLGIP